MAYLLTFSGYGTHLPGSEKGWVDASHCVVGSPVQPRNAEREGYWRSHLTEAPCVLDGEARFLVLKAVLDVCRHREWIAYGVHVRTTHVHAVIGGDAKPERMLSDCKAYATRRLRAGDVSGPRRRYWTDHGSTRYLWNQVSLKAAIEYVINGQGVRMACWPD